MGNTPSTSRNDKLKTPLKTPLFEQEPTGETYRIPALLYLKESHTFLAFAEKRSSTSDKDAKVIVLRRGTLQNGSIQQWSEYQELSSALLPGYRSMNPCPVYEKNTKTLFLFFICIEVNAIECWQIFTGKNKARLCYVTSSDDGQSWGPLTDLTESVIGETVKKWATFAVGPGHGVQMKNGRLIIPAYAYYIPRTVATIPINVTPYALAFYSDDSGQTWQVGKMLQMKSIECEMAEVVNHEGGSHLYCNARNTGGFRVEALSGSGGDHFEKVQLALKLVETGKGCQGSVIGFPNPEFVPNDQEESVGDPTSTQLPPDTQTCLLYSHPTSKSDRKDLGVYLNRFPLDFSRWDSPWIIHQGPSGYSDLTYSEDMNQFGCLMECGEKSETEQIAFVSFNLSDVIGK